MKTIVFYVSVLVVIVRSTSGSEEDERIKLLYAKCKNELHLEESDMESFKTMEMPISQKGKCMMGCLMRESGIIVNGKFSKEGALKVAEKFYSGKPEDMEKVRTVTDICGKQTENEKDECNVAAKLSSCMLEQSQKIGLMPAPQA